MSEVESAEGLGCRLRWSFGELGTPGLIPRTQRLEPFMSWTARPNRHPALADTVPPFPKNRVGGYRGDPLLPLIRRC